MTKLEYAPSSLRTWFVGRKTVRSTIEWVRAVGSDWADRIMSEKIDDRFHAKQGRTIAKWSIPNGPSVYLKRHFDLPLWDGIIAAIFPGCTRSPGLQEADHLEWAANEGFFVPKVIAAGEFLGPWGKLQSFLAVEELKGMLALHEAIPIAQQSMSAEDFAKWKRGLIGELARISRELHLRRYFHQDLYLCHFFVYETDLKTVPADWKNRVATIDFHRLEKHSYFWMKWQAKDLAQLLYSTFEVQGITAKDRVRFWKLYCNGDWKGKSKPYRIVHFTASVKANRYFRHNKKMLAQQKAG